MNPINSYISLWNDCKILFRRYFEDDRMLIYPYFIWFALVVLIWVSIIIWIEALNKIILVDVTHQQIKLGSAFLWASILLFHLISICTASKTAKRKHWNGKRITICTMIVVAVTGMSVLIKIVVI